jgi:hypothetical protein
VSPSPPLLVLGVRRSGTTLLRVMLDRSSQLAVPDESYFVTQLAHRHGRRPDIEAFAEDCRRLSTLRDWGVTPDDLDLRPGTTTGEAIAAVYARYAALQGKPRWGDKTPMYMQHLPLLARLFPEARFVHLIRDGRDAALSFLGVPPGIMTRTWWQPRSAVDFACQWRTEVEAAQRLGRRVGPERYLEVRYEALVADAPGELRRICAFANLPFEDEMLAYAGAVDVSAKPHQQRLLQPPTRNVRDWRTDLAEEDARAFEGVAGDLLRRLGYDLLVPEGRYPTTEARARLARYRALVTAWNATSYATQRSPLWRRRHPRLV